MNEKSFCYWLQGFMEIQNPKKLDKIQTQIIKDHLALVFDKKTPDRRECKTQLSNEPTAEELFDELDKVEPQPGGFIDQPDCHVALC